MLTVVPGEGSGHEGGKGASSSLLDEIVLEGARHAMALERAACLLASRIAFVTVDGVGA